jgi:tRNA(Ile)-lysidine synthase
MVQKKCLVAVSGGVDSVVLLDMLVKQGKREIIVAHFDHGIREDSAVDARFVEALAKKHSLPYFGRREELGPKASEELARERRYAFLREVARETRAVIVTAHHADDVVETIAINILRGTSWRGLAVLGASDIERPLATLKKDDIYSYAVARHLEWVEDSTNGSDYYLRNRVRSQITRRLDEKTKEALLVLWREQTDCRRAIEGEVATVVNNHNSHSRYFFSCIDDESAIELLRYVVVHQTNKRLLDAQLARGVLAIKTALPKTVVQLGAGVEISFSRDSFIALQSEKML